ncbi:MAG: DUF2934 domain-containing protein [Candidatus Thiodiazotropha sp. (ex Ustalcina ferruginea)]|nr:DUF2934 domain-containing protein [Candidatus Thiodiazotropha sp. (ex Ustalcina ferruginea)]
MGKKADKAGRKKEKIIEKQNKKREKKTKKLKQKASTITPEQRLDMIATAAYYIAEKHGFDPLRATQDWEDAEQQIDAILKSIP